MRRNAAAAQDRARQDGDSLRLQDWLESRPATTCPKVSASQRQQALRDRLGLERRPCGCQLGRQASNFSLIVRSRNITEAFVGKLLRKPFNSQHRSIKLLISTNWSLGRCIQSWRSCINKVI